MFQPLSSINILRNQGVVFDEGAARFDFVAHQGNEHFVGGDGVFDILLRQTMQHGLKRFTGEGLAGTLEGAFQQLLRQPPLAGQVGQPGHDAVDLLGRRHRVRGVVVQTDGKALAIEAKKGIVIATGGHTGNVNFRRMFDPRLTEEY